MPGLNPGTQPSFPPFERRLVPLKGRSSLLATHQRIDLRAAGRGRLRYPGLAGVAARPHLAAVGGAGHQARLTLVEGDLEHRVRHRSTDIDLGPAFAAVAAAQQDAEVADKPGAGGAPQVPRVAGHFSDIA